MDDILVSLSRSASGLTFDELSADRVLAAEEIRWLRAELSRAPEGTRAVTLEEHPMRMLRIKEVKVLLGLAQSTIWALAKQGRFPKPFRLADRASAWRIRDLVEWQAGLKRG
jgi:prophage regulatory protein